MGRPIMDVGWIRETWSRRADASLVATEESWIATHRLPVFFGCFICFVGFGEDEQRHLEETAEANAATCVPRHDPRVTHVLVDDGNFRGEFSDDEYGQYHIIKAEWFWGSIHMTCKAEEALYVYSKEGEFVPASRRTPGTPTSPRSHMTNRKRRALKENLAHLAQVTLDDHHCSFSVVSPSSLLCALNVHENQRMCNNHAEGSLSHLLLCSHRLPELSLHSELFARQLCLAVFARLPARSRTQMLVREVTRL